MYGYALPEHKLEVGFSTGEKTMNTIIKTLAITAAIITAANAANAAEPAKATDTVARAEKTAACLVQAGLVKGDIASVKRAEAHFAVASYKTVIGIERGGIDFHPAVYAGKAPGVNLEQVKACMGKGSFKR